MASPRSKRAFDCEQSIYSSYIWHFWSAKRAPYVDHIPIFSILTTTVGVIVWEGRLATSSGKHILSYMIINHHDTEGHARLRKSWDKAFATGPLNDYTAILAPAASRLKEHLKTLCESSHDGRAHVDFAKWMSFFS